MPYELEVESHFSAAHTLRGYKGECERVHGHNFRVIARFLAERLDALGIALDFKEISAGLDEVVRRLDHTDLSADELFHDRNPTAENIAELVYKALAERFAGAPAVVVSVTVYESDRYGATYYERRGR